MTYTVTIDRDVFSRHPIDMIEIYDGEELIYNETSLAMGRLTGFRDGFELAVRLLEAKAQKEHPIAVAIRAARLHQSQLAADQSEIGVHWWRGKVGEPCNLCGVLAGYHELPEVVA